MLKIHCTKICYQSSFCISTCTAILIHLPDFSFNMEQNMDTGPPGVFVVGAGMLALDHLGPKGLQGGTQ